MEETFSIAPSEDGTTTTCVDIGIIDDVIFEGDEQFLVTFGSISSDQVDVGPISQACVTIVDDDGEFPRSMSTFDSQSIRHVVVLSSHKK